MIKMHSGLGGELLCITCHKFAHKKNVRIYLIKSQLSGSIIKGWIGDQQRQFQVPAVATRMHENFKQSGLHINPVTYSIPQTVYLVRKGLLLPPYFVPSYLYGPGCHDLHLLSELRKQMQIMPEIKKMKCYENIKLFKTSLTTTLQSGFPFCSIIL